MAGPYQRTTQISFSARSESNRTISDLFCEQKNYIFFPKKLKSERRSKMDSSPHNYCALLCALSVGAAIVIARPNADAPKRPDSTEQQHFMLCDTAAVETETDSPSTWQKTKSEVKSFAQKSFDFGKRITFKTANVSANFIESIGDSLTTIIQWLLDYDQK